MNIVINYLNDMILILKVTPIKYKKYFYYSIMFHILN